MEKSLEKTLERINEVFEILMNDWKNFPQELKNKHRIYKHYFDKQKHKIGIGKKVEIIEDCGGSVTCNIPDFLHIKPQEKRKLITIDDVLIEIFSNWEKQPEKITGTYLKEYKMYMKYGAQCFPGISTQRINKIIALAGFEKGFVKL
jgi:hypothetical protein